MGTTAEKLSYLNGTKNILKTNLINKGVALTGSETFRGLVNKVNDIQGGSGKVSPEFVSFYNYNGTSLDLSWLDTSNITRMNSMFSGCSNLSNLDLSSFDTSKVTIMEGMFYYCRGFTTLDLSNFDTSKVESMQTMFSNCSSLRSLDLSNFVTSEVTNMTQMFQQCSSLLSLDISSFSASKLTSMSYMFYNCTSLGSLNLSNFDIRNITNTSSVFYRCMALKIIQGILDMQNVTRAGDMFTSCSALEEVHIHNLGVDLKLSDSPKLTHDCLVELINNLQTVTSTKTLTLGSTNLAKLTDAEKQVATNKGWTLA